MQHIEDDDFLIRVRPFRDESGGWTGEIDLSVVTLPDNDFNDEDYQQLIHFCTMMAATVPIMEHDEAMRDYVHDYVMNKFDMEDEDVVEPTNEVTITQEDGNVVRLSFGTTTKGSA